MISIRALLSRADLRTFADFAPLLAAVIAPLSTLLDIPALTEPWFFRNGNALPDRKINLALSALGLVFNIAANALLIVRFSVSSNWGWRKASVVSTMFWFAKCAIALGNVLAFGLLTRNEPGISYGEGFFCAVVALLISIVIAGLLLLHYVLQFKHRREMTSSQLQMRIAGRHFMLQNTAFVFTIGILALYTSELEDWTYLQGIYFSVLTFLTVGFGDFYPTKPATQIVLFPFALLGIVQLAIIIEMLVSFISSRMATRHARRRAKFERVRQRKEDNREKLPDLQREIQFLQEVYIAAGRDKMMQDLVVNITGFLTFWILGALIFSEIEYWTYGQGLYFCYVFFLSIGYGDYAPVTPAGRVVFTIYSITAVPIMASFAVQTIMSLLRRLSHKRLQQRRAEAGLVLEADMENRGEGNGEVNNTLDSAHTPHEGVNEPATEPPREVRRRIASPAVQWNTSHAENVASAHERIEDRLKGNGHGESHNAVEGEGRNEDRVLTEYILELAIELEKHARRLLLTHMKEDTPGHTLLKADRVIQLRNIHELANWEGAGKPDGICKLASELTRKYYEEEADLSFSRDPDDKATLEEVRKYRESFADILAAGGRFMKLKDEEQLLFERRIRTID